MSEKETASNLEGKPQKPILFVLGIIVGLGILSLVGILAFSLGRKSQSSTVFPSPSPEISSPVGGSPTPETSLSPTPTLKPRPTSTPTPTPTSTPTPIPTSTPTPTSSPQADLYISEYSFNHPPKQGEPFTVRIGIYNQGDAAAGPFWWEWWATWAIRACRERIDGLAAHGGRIVECTFTYNSWANYETKAIADADNEVAESNEDNNTYTQTVMPIH